MENYQIIADLDKLKEFINWLPELETNETYYLCLFARNKYVRDTPEYFPHIRADKAQVKRFTANKHNMIEKIAQLETKFGSYTTKTGFPVPQMSLALYITVNPRDQHEAMLNLMAKCVDILKGAATDYNIHQEALSAIQKSCSRKIYTDVDFDDKTVDELKEQLKDVLNEDCYQILQTRGGCHLLVKNKAIDTKYVKTWYNKMKELGADVTGDNLIPVPGTFQGGFIPTFIIN